MNEQQQYTFMSAKGISVTITTRMGEASARNAAMQFLWGPPSGWCQNVGAGLHLTPQDKEKKVG